MSFTDISNARRLLREAEKDLLSHNVNVVDKARIQAQLAAGWCQVHQVEKR